MAAVSVFAEVQSFVTKFMQLTSLGLHGSLNLSNNDGRMLVNFSMDLGSLLSPSSENFAFAHRIKPSRVRRRKRRENARASTISHPVETVESNDSVISAVNEGSNDVQSTSSTPSVSSEIVSSLPLTNENYENTTEEPSVFQPLFLCTAYAKAFTSTSLLEQHKKEHDFVPECFPLVCEKCHKTFEPIEFMDHMDSPCHQNISLDDH